MTTIKPGDLVKIRDCYYEAVVFYKYNGSPLVGRVTKVKGDRFHVDFVKREKGRVYGDKVRFRAWDRYDHLWGEGFPVDMLERVS